MNPPKCDEMDYINFLIAAQRFKDWCGGKSQCRSPVQSAATSIRVEL